ncbi:MAG: integration host factor subunit beta [Bacteroidetes bacterium]|nr:integration host factor subunit beta [Bacteroidota bacterium]
MIKNITKADIVDIVAKATGITKIDTKAVVEGVLTSIVEAISKGHKIEIRGFGVFHSKKRKARLARNPKNGEIVSLNEKYIPLFKVSNDFTKKVNAVRLPEQTVNTDVNKLNKNF